MLTASAAPCKAQFRFSTTSPFRSLRFYQVFSAGKTRVNVVAAASDATVALPPCNCRMAVTMASPNPVEAAESLRAGSAR